MKHSAMKEFDVVNSVREEDPKSYGHYMRISQKDKWAVSIRKELCVEEENKEWTVEVPPTGSHVLHTKWVLRRRPKRMERSKVTKRDSWPVGASNFSGPLVDLSLPPLWS